MRDFFEKFHWTLKDHLLGVVELSLLVCLSSTAGYQGRGSQQGSKLTRSCEGGPEFDITAWCKINICFLHLNSTQSWEHCYVIWNPDYLCTIDYCRTWRHQCLWTHNLSLFTSYFLVLNSERIDLPLA